MPSKFNAVFLIISAIGFSANARAADMTGAIPYQHVIQATESCASCHAKIRSEHAAEVIMANDCEECHTSGESSPIVRVDDRHFADPYADKLQVPPPANATAGMSVPMYYDETRIGKDPNPMVLIPAGKFLRGSNNRMPDEGPQYTVETRAFWIDKYEVTNLQYKQFIDATNR